MAAGRLRRPILFYTPADLSPNPVLIGESVHAQLDLGASALVYCDSSSGAVLGGFPFEDSGFVPPNPAALKCQNGAAKAIAQLAAAIVKCQVKQAGASFKAAMPVDDEPPCEMTAEARFSAVVGALMNCPSCLPSPLSSLAGVVEAGVDAGFAENGGIFCASPGGAFLN